jgi:hypothetical protein
VLAEACMGCHDFADLLKDVESEGCIELEYDETGGNYKARLLDY